MLAPLLAYRWCLIVFCLVCVFVRRGVAQLPSAAQDQAAYVHGFGPLYHSNDTLNAHLNALATSKHLYAKWKVITNTTTKKIHYAELGNWNIVNGARRTGVITCGLHAREVFAVQICYWLTRFMATDVDSLLTFPELQMKLLATGKFGSGSVDKTRLVKWIADILNKMRLIIIPLMNAEGYVVVEGGKYYQRKTPGSPGVDLNRNWPLGFNQSDSKIREANPAGENYRGPQPLSEYQTYTVYQAAKTQWKPTMFMDIHTGTEGIWTPWGHTMSLAEVPDSDILAWDRWFAAMNQKAITGASVQVGGGAGSFGELTPGSVESTFYAPSEINAKYSMTAETYSPTGEVLEWVCPTMRAFKADCTTSGCGCTNCRDTSGVVINCETCNCSVAAAGGRSVATGWKPLRRDAKAEVAASTGYKTNPRDPFLNRYYQNVNCSSCPVLKKFNPITPAAYRESLSRWLVTLMLGIEYVANNP